VNVGATAWRRWLPVGLWLVVCVAAQESAVLTRVVDDKAAHAAVFAVLGVLVYLVLTRGMQVATAGAIFLTLTFALAVGATDELLQSWQRTRTPDFADLAFDLGGAALGAIAAAALARRA
jgi:VanZ family protein